MVDAAAGADVGADVAGSASVGGAAEASVVTAADYVPKQGDSVQVWLPGLPFQKDCLFVQQGGANLKFRQLSSMPVPKVCHATG